MMTTFLLGVVCGGLLAVALSVLDEALRRRPTRPTVEDAYEIDPAERHWVKRGPAGGR